MTLPNPVGVGQSGHVDAHNEIAEKVNALSSTYVPSVIVQGTGIDPTGAANSATAIQNVLDAAAAGSLVTFPAGTYRIDSAVSVNKKLHIVGHGATLRAGAYIDGASGMFIINAVSGVTVEGLHVDGGTATPNRGVRVQVGTTDLLLRDMVIENLGQANADTTSPTAVRIYGNCHRIKIQGCTIRNVVPTLSTVGKGVQVSPIGAEGNTKDVQVVGCHFENIQPTGDGDGIFLQGCENWTVIGNTFRSCYKRAVKILAPGRGTVADNAVYNPFGGAGRGEVQPYAAISVYGDNTTVTGNTIVGGSWSQAGIEVGTAGTAINGVSVTGNRIRQDDDADVDGGAASADGIRVFGTGFAISVVGNSVTRARIGVNITSAHRSVIVSDNIVQALMQYGIQTGADSTTPPSDVIISGNTITAPTLNGVHVGTAITGQARIENNVVSGGSGLYSTAALPYVKALSKGSAPQAFLKAGHYYQATPSGGLGTSNSAGNGDMRATPFYVPRDVTIDRMGLEVTAAGDVGSTLRLGIYADDGSGYPGALVLDAGSVAGDSTGVKEVTISQALAAGLYWVAAVVQGVTTTKPTLRTIATYTRAEVSFGTGAPGVGGLPTAAWLDFGVTAGLPGTFDPASNPTAVAPRIFVRVAP